MVAAGTMALGPLAKAGVNLETTTPPGYSKPLTLYIREGKILGAWGVGNKGNRDASALCVTRLFPAPLTGAGTYCAGGAQSAEERPALCRAHDGGRQTPLPYGPTLFG